MPWRQQASQQAPSTYSARMRGVEPARRFSTQFNTGPGARVRACEALPTPEDRTPQGKTQAPCDKVECTCGVARGSACVERRRATFSTCALREAVWRFQRWRTAHHKESDAGGHASRQPASTQLGGWPGAWRRARGKPLKVRHTANAGAGEHVSCQHAAFQNWRTTRHSDADAGGHMLAGHPSALG